MLQAGSKSESKPFEDRNFNKPSWYLQKGPCGNCPKNTQHVKCSQNANLNPHGDICRSCHSCILIRGKNNFFKKENFFKR